MARNPKKRLAASPDQLEQEIAATRAEIDRKLAVLQRRLSPRQVAGSLTSTVASQGATFARNLGTSLRDNPVPATLLGIGLGWLMLAGSGKRTVPVQSGAANSRAPRAVAALAAAEGGGFRQIEVENNTGAAAQARVADAGGR